MSVTEQEDRFRASQNIGFRLPGTPRAGGMKTKREAIPKDITPVIYYSSPMGLDLGIDPRCGFLAGATTWCIVQEAIFV